MNLNYSPFSPATRDYPQNFQREAQSLFPQQNPFAPKTGPSFEEYLDRLRGVSQAESIQSQRAFRPQMDALRGGVMAKMAQNLGVALPQYQAGTKFPMAAMNQPAPQFKGGTQFPVAQPPWMQEFQSPQFPRY
jgi:hypothetical protein